MKKIASLLLTVALLVTMLSVFALSASAADTDKYIVRDWDQESKTVTETETDIPADAKEITADTEVLERGWYVVRKSTQINRRITVNGTSRNPTRIILLDGVTLTVNGGIRLSKDQELNIYGQKENTGTITATALDDDAHAGIGGNNARLRLKEIDKNGEKCGVLTVYGGTVNATGGESSAGIGGGGDGIEFYQDGGDGGTVTVYGGTVNAIGGKNGAGIGGGKRSDGGTITVYDGTVNATGGEYGVGIGGDWDGSGTVTINGGTVNATGGENGAGIGGNFNYKGGSVTINGGTVNATGGKNGAGIGGNFNCAGGTVTINGGTVNATGGENGAGIGGGSCSNVGGTITANGGIVTINGGAINASVDKVHEKYAKIRGFVRGPAGDLILGDFAVLKIGDDKNALQKSTSCDLKKRYAQIHFHDAENLTRLDGTQHKCNFCGEIESHTYVNAKCNCGDVSAHEHTYDENSICTICLCECPHDEWQKGKCTVCSAKGCEIGKLDHTWVNGVCSVCNKSCDHEWDATTGICKVCEYQCPHNGATGDTCDTCGSVIHTKGNRIADIMLSKDSWWIIGVEAVVVAGVAALFIIKKKKKNRLSGR